jgi:DNA-binding GntR family transcriptional regulator
LRVMSCAEWCIERWCHRNAAELANSEEYYRLNDEFHRAIVLGASSKTLSDAHERVMARHLANKNEPFGRNAASHHQKIVNAILRGDAEEAERAMREHLLEVTRIIGTSLSHETTRAQRSLRRRRRLAA